MAGQDAGPEVCGRVCPIRAALRIALIDGERCYSYADLDSLSDKLALKLLDLGLQPQDRLLPLLPNVAEFVILYFTLQKLGCILIAALVTHRFTEVNQFTALAQARCVVYPASAREQGGDFHFAPIIERVQAGNPCLQLRLVLGPAGPGEHSLTALIDRFVRQGDSEEVLLETCGRPVCADDEVTLIDDDGREVADGEVGELAARVQRAGLPRRGDGQGVHGNAERVLGL